MSSNFIVLLQTNYFTHFLIHNNISGIADRTWNFTRVKTTNDQIVNEQIPNDLYLRIRRQPLDRLGTGIFTFTNDSGSLKFSKNITSY